MCIITHSIFEFGGLTKSLRSLIWWLVSYMFLWCLCSVRKASLIQGAIFCSYINVTVSCCTCLIIIHITTFTWFHFPASHEMSVVSCWSVILASELASQIHKRWSAESNYLLVLMIFSWSVLWPQSVVEWIFSFF